MYCNGPSILGILNDKSCVLDTNVASFVGYQDLIEAYNTIYFLFLSSIIHFPR